LEQSPQILLLKEGRTVHKGTYEEIIAAGFNIKDILDSYNQALMARDEDGDKAVKFVDEASKHMVQGTSKETANKKTDHGAEGTANAPKIANEKSKDLIVAEEKFEDDIGFQDYMNLFSFSIGAWAIVIYALVSILTTILQLAPSYLLVKWASMDLKEQQESTTMMRLFVFSIVAYMVFVLIRSISMQAFVLQATTNMHHAMTESVIRANILFFDSNPSGRIVSRFSKDISILDTTMPVLTVICTQGVLRAISVLITVAIVNPWLIVPAVVGLIYMLLVAKAGIKPMIEAQRFDFLFYGPIN